MFPYQGRCREFEHEWVRAEAAETMSFQHEIPFGARKQDNLISCSIICFQAIFEFKNICLDVLVISYYLTVFVLLLLPRAKVLHSSIIQLTNQRDCLHMALSRLSFFRMCRRCLGVYSAYKVFARP